MRRGDQRLPPRARPTGRADDAASERSCRSTPDHRLMRAGSRRGQQPDRNAGTRCAQPRSHEPSQRVRGGLRRPDLDPTGVPDDRSPRSLETLRRQARRRPPDVHRAPGHGHRLPRPERRRQVDDDAHDPRPRPADDRLGHRQRQGLPGPRRAAAGGRRDPRGARDPHRPVRLHAPARARPDARHPAQPRGRGDRARRAAGRRPQARRARSRSAWASGWASPRRCSATRRR